MTRVKGKANSLAMHLEKDIFSPARPVVFNVRFPGPQRVLGEVLDGLQMNRE